MQCGFSVQMSNLNDGRCLHPVALDSVDGFGIEAASHCGRRQDGYMTRLTAALMRQKRSVMNCLGHASLRPSRARFLGVTIG